MAYHIKDAQALLTKNSTFQTQTHFGSHDIPARNFFEKALFQEKRLMRGRVVLLLDIQVILVQIWKYQ